MCEARTGSRFSPVRPLLTEESDAAARSFEEKAEGSGDSLVLNRRKLVPFSRRLLVLWRRVTERTYAPYSPSFLADAAAALEW